ncbi:hypothetical protein Q9189_002484 [Teloschistes chrysophthalmus]
MCIALQLASLGNASYLRHMLIPRQNSSAPSTDGSAATPATTGIATFVDFAHEGNTVCGPLAGAESVDRSEWCMGCCSWKYFTRTRTWWWLRGVD